MLVVRVSILGIFRALWGPKCFGGFEILRSLGFVVLGFKLRLEC